MVIVYRSARLLTSFQGFVEVLTGTSGLTVLIAYSAFPLES
jgi:hypothetical protein